MLLGEDAFAAHRLEVRIDDVLGRRRVAADMPPAQLWQFERRHFPHHVAKVEVGFRDRLHVLAADVAQVTLVAFRHDLRSWDLSFRGTPPSDKSNYNISDNPGPRSSR